MTKPDTKEIKKKYNYKAEDRLTASLVSYAPLLTEWCDEILELCDAYDEAQKKIEELNEIKNGALHFSNLVIKEKKERISTLGALLRDVCNHKMIRYRIRCHAFVCNYCAEGAAMAGECESIQHKPDCLFTRIQKELGEG